MCVECLEQAIAWFKYISFAKRMKRTIVRTFRAIRNSRSSRTEVMPSVSAVIKDSFKRGTSMTDMNKRRFLNLMIATEIANKEFGEGKSKSKHVSELHPS
jgi:hypothetical protein